MELELEVLAEGVRVEEEVVVGRGVDGVSVSVLVEAKARPVLGRRAAPFVVVVEAKVLLCVEFPNGDASSFPVEDPKSS